METDTPPQYLGRLAYKRDVYEDASYSSGVLVVPLTNISLARTKMGVPTRIRVRRPIGGPSGSTGWLAVGRKSSPLAGTVRAGHGPYDIRLQRGMKRTGSGAYTTGVFRM